MSLLLNNPSHTAGEEWQENSEYDHQSPLTWKGIDIDDNKMVALGRVIEEIINNKDELPEELVEAAKAILEVSSGINWLNSCKEDFKRIIGPASILVIVLWQSYTKSKYRSLGWPPPKLRASINDLIETIHRIHKLMKRKFKNLAKRILEGYFVRDLGKFKKYQERLDSVASVWESTPSNIKINEVLLEVLDSRAQHHDESTELPEQPAGRNAPVRHNTQKRTVIQGLEPTAEGSNSQRKKTAVKFPVQKVTVGSEGEDDKDDDDETESKPLVITNVKNNANNNSEAQRSKPLTRSKEDRSTTKTTNRKSLGHEIVPQPEMKETMRTKRDTKFDEYVPRSEDKGKRKKMAELDKDMEERTLRRGSSWANNKTPPSKVLKKLSGISEDEGSNSEDIPVNDLPATSTVPLQKKMTPKQNAPWPVRSQTAPPQSSISNFSFSNNGPGTMNNRNVGNINNLNISDVGNNNSENYYGYGYR